MYVHEPEIYLRPALSEVSASKSSKLTGEGGASWVQDEIQASVK